MAKKALFSSVILFLALVVTDRVAGCAGVGEPAAKSWIYTSEGEGNCYSSDPYGTFPLDIAGNQEQRARMGRILRHYKIGGPLLMDSSPETDLARLVELTPHCLIYDVAKRSTGPAPERQQSAVIVGDSFAFGEGVPDQHSLGFEMSRRCPGTNFRNLAQPGLPIDLIRQNVDDWLAEPRDQPVTLIYFYNINDALVDRGLDANSHCPVANPSCDVALAYDPKSHWGRVVEASTLIRLAYEIHRQKQIARAILTAYQDTYFKPANKANLTRTFDIIAGMQAAATARGVQLRVVLYPFLVSDMSSRSPLQPIHELVMRELKRRKVTCIDGSGAFADAGSLTKLRVHQADSHPNGRAHALMAQYLAPRICPPHK